MRTKTIDPAVFEHQPGEPETLGDEKGRFEGEVPPAAIRASEEARHPRVRDADGAIKEGHRTGNPRDSFAEEKVSDEPKYESP